MYAKLGNVLLKMSSKSRQDQAWRGKQAVYEPAQDYTLKLNSDQVLTPCTDYRSSNLRKELIIEFHDYLLELCIGDD